MHTDPRRMLAAAGLISLVAVTGACSDTGSEPEETAGSPTGPTGCDGSKAPVHDGPAQAYDSVTAVGEKDAIGVQASQPTKTKASSGAKGWSVATVDVHARVLTNGVYAVSPDSVMLVDPAGRLCTRPRTEAVKSPLPVTEIDEAEPASGAVSFLVPDDANLSKYTVMYADDPAAKKADAEWSVQGAPPTGTSSTACTEGTLSPLTLAEGVEREPWGESRTVGDEGSQLRITAEKPTARALKPSTKHPNDVDGLVVNIDVEAIGSAAFLDRGMFQMFDGKGTLCRYGELGTEGETLSTDLVPAGESRSYTLIFWAPKGAANEVKQPQLIYRTSNETNEGVAGWANPKDPGTYPSVSPKKRAEDAKKKAEAAKKSSSSSSSSGSPSSGTTSSPSETSSAPSSTP